MSQLPITIDLIGERCPIPVKKIRKLLRKYSEGTVIHALGDDPESLHDIPALLIRLNFEPAVITKEEIGWKFIIRN